MKAPKPSKTDILSELESIRHSLVGESATIREPDQTSDTNTADSLQKDIAEINSELLTTLSLLDDPQVDTTEQNSINTNEEYFDEDDIPVLDDLVIDDDTCLETVNKIVSTLDEPENTDSYIERDIKAKNTEKKDFEKQNLQQADTEITSEIAPEIALETALEIDSIEETNSELNDTQTEPERPLELFENLKIHSEPEKSEPEKKDGSYKDRSNLDEHSEFENDLNLNSEVSSNADPDTATPENQRAIKTTLLGNAAAKVLPGQRSLFDDDIHSPPSAEESKKDSTTKHASNTPLLDKDLSFKGQSNIEKATKQIFDRDASSESMKENPFLPPHIRERLAKQKIVMADDAKAHLSALASLKSSASLLSNSSKIDDYAGSDSYYPAPVLNASKSTDDNTFSTSELENPIEKSLEIDTSALVKEILSQKTEALADALLDAKDGLEISLNKSAKPSKESVTSTPHVDSSITDQLLIESLMQQLMPDLEKALREKLKEQMKQKTSKNPTSSLFDS